jgi:Dockerin type I domain
MRDVPGSTSTAPDDDAFPVRLAQDLGALYPTPRVPEAVDARVLALTQSSAASFAARRSYAQRHTSRLLRWVGAGAAAAAVAAAVVVAVKLPFRQPAAPGPGVQARLPEAVNPAPAVADARPGDVDRSGTVDILDAFALAKKIESAQNRGPGWEDVNGDGVLNKADVDRIAHTAVRVAGDGGGNLQ